MNWTSCNKHMKRVPYQPMCACCCFCFLLNRTPHLLWLLGAGPSAFVFVLALFFLFVVGGGVGGWVDYLSFVQRTGKSDQCIWHARQHSCDASRTGSCVAPSFGSHWRLRPRRRSRHCSGATSRHRHTGCNSCRLWRQWPRAAGHTLSSFGRLQTFILAEVSKPLQTYEPRLLLRSRLPADGFHA